jgi:predicted permease
MKVELFVLCDAATDYQGKLNLLGTFDSIWAKQMPAVHPICAVALRLRFLKIEEGEHKIKISIVDGDGKAVVRPVEANVNILFKNTPLTSMATNMILNLQGLTFPGYGEYSIDLAIDGRHEASLPLYINQMREQSNN